MAKAKGKIRSVKIRSGAITVEALNQGRRAATATMAALSKAMKTSEEPRKGTR